MFQNYLKIAIRVFLKQKGISMINTVGLSLGFAVCTLILVYIFHETSYDKSLPNSEHIYRLVNSFSYQGQEGKGIHMSANNGATLEHDFEEITAFGRILDNNLFYGAGENNISFDGDEEQYAEKGFAYADQSLIDMFEIKMLYGERSLALSSPKSIILSRSKAEKYFRTENPVGKVLYLNGNLDDPFTIKGVMEDFPSNSHLSYDFFITLKDVEFGPGEQTRWIQNNYFTYFLVSPETDVSRLSKKVSDVLIFDYLKPAYIQQGYALGEKLEQYASFTLQPIRDIHLHSADIAFESGFRNDIKIIWIFGIIALFILLIAAVNFINLSTAKSVNRAKEVGLRKVVGSTRSYLVGQFLTESTITCFVAMILSIGLAQLSIPYFRMVTGLPLSLPLDQPFFYVAMGSAAIVIGVVAGLYPAFYLSRYKPINVLKGRLYTGSKSGGLRNSLVVFQFAISIALIIGTLVVNDQMNFLLNAKVGFEKDQVIQIYGTNIMGEQVSVFKEELKNLSSVNQVSISDYLPLAGTKRNGNSFVNEGREGIDETVGGQAWLIDEDYLETLGIKLVEGRNFSRSRSEDQLATIINETMARKLGLDQAIGKRISRSGTLYEVIGVVEDFNFNIMKEVIQPLCFFLGTSPGITSVKLNAGNFTGDIVQIEKKWREFVPNMAFRYEFMDHSFAAMYSNVSRIKTIFGYFTILTVLVACLGLFALSAYMAEQRTKEIGVRKVLGASVFSVVSLLSKDFLRLVIFALVIAVPISWYWMNNWLEDFAYRIEIKWWVFGLAGLITIGIAFFTVSFQCVKAAVANPISSLRSE